MAVLSNRKLYNLLIIASIFANICLLSLQFMSDIKERTDLRIEINKLFNETLARTVVSVTMRRGIDLQEQPEKGDPNQEGNEAQVKRKLLSRKRCLQLGQEQNQSGSGNFVSML